jgi:hypothetical protein
LNDESDGPVLGIRVDDSERDPLGVFIGADDNEVTGFSFFAILEPMMNWQMASAIVVLSKILFGINTLNLSPRAALREDGRLEGRPLARYFASTRTRSPY